MFTASFEALESRRFMSVTTLVDQVGLTGGDDEAAVTVPMNYSAKTGITTPTPATDVTRFKGSFREKSDKIFFVTTMQITKVTANGTVRGKLTIPWIVSNAEIRGKIGPDRRFQLKFEENWGQATGTKGWYNGRVTSDYKKVVGTMKYGFGTQPATTAKGFSINFGRKVSIF
jgi:hypothetical protein